MGMTLCQICNRSLAGHLITRWSAGAAAKTECQDGGTAVGFTDRDMYQLCLTIGRDIPQSLLAAANAGGYR